jgi:hypothetical protein
MLHQCCCALGGIAEVHLAVFYPSLNPIEVATGIEKRAFPQHAVDKECFFEDKSLPLECLAYDFSHFSLLQTLGTRAPPASTSSLLKARVPI